MNFEIVKMTVSALGAAILIWLMVTCWITFCLSEMIKKKLPRWMMCTLFCVIIVITCSKSIVIPEYQTQEKLWKQKEEERRMKEKIKNAPWVTISYVTRVLSVSRQQQLIFLNRFDTVEFMDEQYVYHRTISMQEGPWRQIQQSFYHNLLHLRETGESIEVTYKTKGPVDPTGQRVIQKIRLLPQEELIWSDEEN